MQRNWSGKGGPNEPEILSAIWILSCNDENAIITYEGIRYRLDLSEEFDVKSLIRAHAELFRAKVTIHRLDRWKKQMREGKYLPSWIRAIEDKSVRNQTISALTPEDVFRNQFRAGAQAEPAPVELIEWGLQHIERLRKVNVEAKEERTRKLSAIGIPLLSTLVALSAILSSVYLQNRSIDTQVVLKKYEVAFVLKRDGYASFMKSLINAYENAYRKDMEELVHALDRIEAAYYSVEPFLSKKDRSLLWNQYQQFSGMCYGLAELPAESKEKRKKYHDSFLWYKSHFRTNLFESLFLE